MSYSSTTSYRHQRYFCTNSLKRTSVWHGERKCLFPLRIYTALKHTLYDYTGSSSLFSLQIYTALKQNRIKRRTYISLFSLRIYTALKLFIAHIIVNFCFPYEFTLLSNELMRNYIESVVCFPYEFTLLSN